MKISFIFRNRNSLVFAALVSVRFRNLRTENRKLQAIKVLKNRGHHSIERGYLPFAGMQMISFKIEYGAICCR
jgi:hypothetical protein